MEVVYDRCCGVVVSRDLISACVLLAGKREDDHRLMRSITPATRELQLLAEWLEELRVTHVAVKAAGRIWRPLWRALAGKVEFILADEKHLPAPPSSVASEQEWLAELLQHGLIPISALSPAETSYEAELSEYRSHLQHQRHLWATSIRDLLEQANLRLSSVVSDVMGESGRSILKAVLDGQYESEQLAQLAKGRLRSKIPQLKLALEGRLEERQRFLLREWLDLWGILGIKLERAEQELQRTGSAAATASGGSDRRSKKSRNFLRRH